ncbi:MAG: hypothetical protein ACXWUH_17470 [Burkholderiales bacterium]
MKVAVDPARDVKLGVRDADHLFKASILTVALRKHAYLRSYAFALIDLCAALVPHAGTGCARRASRSMSND